MEKFAWDGSYLGTFPVDIIKASHKSRLGRYCQIQIDKARGIGILRPSKNLYPCLIDELKTVFNLIKHGTHSLKINNQLFIFTRLLTKKKKNHEVILEDLSLKDLKINPQQMDLVFRQQIQELLAFRDILAISRSYEGSIYIRVPDNRRPYPISIREYTMNFTHRNSMLSHAMMKKWFDDRSVSDVLICMLRIDLDQLDMPFLLAKYRSEIEEVFNRIDKKLICSSLFILERMMSRILLQS